VTFLAAVGSIMRARRSRISVAALFVKVTREAFAHFGGGFVRKSDRENRAGIDAFRDEVGRPRSDDARFASAGAGQNQKRPLDRGDSFALRVIEIEESKTRHVEGALSCPARKTPERFAPLRRLRVVVPTKAVSASDLDKS
jgi:hypothetical protein